jgi:hypothetical protein
MLPRDAAKVGGRTNAFACLVGMQMPTSVFQSFIFVAIAATVTTSVGCGDNQFIVEGEHYQYVVSDISLANSVSEAGQQGVDLDGNGRNDNLLGEVFALLRTYGFDMQPDVTAAVRNGGILLGLDVQTPSLREANLVGVQAYHGVSTVPAPCTSGDPLSCGQHLLGNAQIRVAPSLGVNYATGPLRNGAAITYADALTLTLALGTDVLIDVTLHDVVVRLTDLTSTSGNATFAGIVSEQDVHDVVLPQTEKQFNRIIDRDCPMESPATACVCARNSSGEQLVDLLDTNRDCNVSDDEMRSNHVVRALTASDIESSVGPGLSFSVRAKLVAAQLLPN